MTQDRLIFVVDDDPSVLRTIERLLKMYGFNVQTFDSAEAFLDCAKFDEAVCLVLDIHLTGISGIELTRQLALRGASLPVVFITAKDSEATRKAALDVGCIAYLQKPFRSSSLMEAIGKAAAEPN